jgi:formylglycine-generating enzyme required for sulfatase activity
MVKRRMLSVAQGGSGILLLLIALVLLGTFGYSADKTPKATEKQLEAAKTAGTLTILLPGGVPLEMVRIPSGKFIMGSKPDSKDAQKSEFPAHEVTINDDFYLATHELTQKQWVAVTGHNPSSHTADLNCPVENLSWNGCQVFIKALNKLGQGVFRLPSEAEWEYACRGGTKTRWSFGDDPSQLPDYSWCAATWGTKSQAHAVGGKLPNPFGLYDMHGNMWEWVQDWYHPNYEGAPTDGSAWNDEDPDFPFKVLRGGAWFVGPSLCRSAYRNVQFCRVDYPVHFNCTYHHGLRLARNP